MAKLADLTFESSLPSGATAVTGGAGSSSAQSAGGLSGLSLSTNKWRTYNNSAVSGSTAYVDIVLGTLAGTTVGKIRGVGFKYRCAALTVQTGFPVKICELRHSAGATLTADILATSTGGQLAYRVQTDSGLLGPTSIGSAPHALFDGNVHDVFLGVELDTAGSSLGSLVVIIDGVTLVNLTTVDNNTVGAANIDRVRIGSSANGGNSGAEQYYDGLYVTDDLTTYLSSEVGTGPIPTATTINSAGDTLTITFNANVSVGAGGSGGLTLTCATGAVTATYSSGAGTTDLDFALSRTVYAGESLTREYTQPGDGLEATSGGSDVVSFTTQAVTNGSTQDSITGNTSPVAASARTITLTSALSSPAWASDDTDVMTVSGGVVTLLQAAGGVATITDGGGTEDVEFLPRTVIWSLGNPQWTGSGLGADIDLDVTLTGYSDGATVGTYDDVAPSASLPVGVTFDGFTGTEPSYTANFTTTDADGPWTAYVNGVLTDLAPVAGGAGPLPLLGGGLVNSGLVNGGLIW